MLSSLTKMREYFCYQIKIWNFYIESYMLVFGKTFIVFCFRGHWEVLWMLISKDTSWKHLKIYHQLKLFHDLCNVIYVIYDTNEILLWAGAYYKLCDPHICGRWYDVILWMFLLKVWQLQRNKAGAERDLRSSFPNECAIMAWLIT